MKTLRRFVLIVSFLFCLNAFSENTIHIPILCYHNLSMIPGSMNLTPDKFESQLKWIKDNGFTVVPLKEVSEYLKGNRASLPDKSIVITFDDGWQSAYKYLFPIVEKYQIPVTLFIYPETISNGKNAMTWDELKELQKTGFFDIQSHTYSHPNFKVEKRHRSQESYEKFVKFELIKSKKILEDKMGKTITLLAWPFGIYDNYLEDEAKNAGYEMAFSIDARSADKSFQPMMQPRFMIVDHLSMKSFTHIVNQAK